MEQCHLDIYGTLELEQTNLISSTLYNLKPFGSTGSDVESLSSYILRLANAHCVSTPKLTNNIMLPSFEEKYQLFKLSTIINGFNNLTVHSVHVLEKLTCRDDLQKLTLINFRNVLSGTFLLKRHREWCPLCMQNMKIPYDKLIWNITAYEVCPSHLIKLESNCPNCGKGQTVIPANGKNGYCQHCNCWLGRNEHDTSLSDIDDESIYKSTEIESILEYFFNKDPIDKKHLINSLRKIDRYLSEHVNVKGFFEGEVGLARNAFNRYCKGKGSPTIEHLVALSSRLNVSLINMLIEYGVKPSLETDQLLPKNRKYNEEYDYERVKQYLITALNSNRYVTIYEITEEFGMNPTTLDTNFPSLMNEIRIQNQRLQKRIRSARAYNHKKDYAKVKKYLEALLHSNEFIPISNIHKELGMNSRTLANKFPDLLNKIRMKNKRLRENASVKRDPGEIRYRPAIDKKYVGRTLQNYLNLIEDKPIYLIRISQEIGISHESIKRHFPEIVALIHKKNREVLDIKKNKRKQELRQTIEEMIENGVYPSLNKLHDRLGYSVSLEFAEVRKNILKEFGIKRFI
ncbi:hypothetical protein CVD25_09965 [Bacillus canaveralius]|uniref:TniQ domain-containing protein n=1 Tax=Bacillus canaveralius TaxID=1403243 RepID=A0A2N5GMJ8_9BACI|nr:TniQ family protein [Bacillus canaveralius]PLR83033.1 hypothetical protein CU635_11235 [Bacillus canaveralius]PLR96963.1 hypothetical protein CVD25_09965 [Bacillus canaveralius]